MSATQKLTHIRSASLKKLHTVMAQTVVNN